MKKILFSAVLATVAIGGAFAQYSLNPSGGAPTFNCVQTSAPQCSTLGTIYFADGSGPVPTGSPAYSLFIRNN